MGQQINQYTIDRTTFGENDYYDVDYWDGATYQTAKIKGSVLKAGVSGIGMYSQISSSTPLTNTTTETSLFNGATSVGSLTIPANSFSVGDSYHAKIGGFISCLINSDITIRVKSGSVILADTGIIQLPTITAKAYEIGVDFTIRTIGGSGIASIITTTQFNYVPNSGSAYNGNNHIQENTSTFDTTGSNALVVTWEWATASASNRINSDVVNFRQIY